MLLAHARPSARFRSGIYEVQIHVVDHDEMLLLLTVNEKYERSDGRHLLGEQNSEERVNILRVLVWPSLRLIKGGVSRGVK